jgi:hypothetical protein
MMNGLSVPTPNGKGLQLGQWLEQPEFRCEVSQTKILEGE